MNILAIGCHPDDVEINCVGTLIRCVQRGDNVTVCHFCNGNMGHEVIMPDELRLIRAAEAEKAGSLAGIKVINGDIGDLLANGYDMEQRNKAIKIIRETENEEDVVPNLMIGFGRDEIQAEYVAEIKLRNINKQYIPRRIICPNSERLPKSHRFIIWIISAVTALFRPNMWTSPTLWN